MEKFNYNSYSTERLFKVILNLKTVEECQAFFDDICTIKEIQDIAQRLDTAILLNDGYNYQSITKRLGISTATISRVSKCLKYGSGGYKNALHFINKDFKDHNNS